MQLENAYSPFRPFYITSIYGLGKAANPPDISLVGVCEFYKISNSPTPFLRTQNNVANFPLPRGREANSSPCIPRHIPLVGPGSYPRGKPMTCALPILAQFGAERTSGAASSRQNLHVCSFIGAFSDSSSSCYKSDSKISCKTSKMKTVTYLS